MSSLIKLKETFGSGKVERYDKTPFYQLEYKQRRLFSKRIKNYSLEEIIMKMVLDPSGTFFLFLSFFHISQLQKKTIKKKKIFTPISF